MVIFATPDFGTGACMSAILVLAWAATLVLAAAAIASGVSLRKSKSPFFRRIGLSLLLVGASVPLLCCVGPPCLIRIAYGNFPIGAYPSGKVKEGMSADEVTAALGTPHERYKQDGRESWYYWRDSYGIAWFCVRFGSDGRVEDTHGD